MNIAIIDDDIHFSNMFYQLISKQLSSIFESYNITVINDDFISCLKSNSFNIIFLDIDLKNLTGINLAAMLKGLKMNPIIIFVSSRNDLVFDALTVQPFQFIRKSNLLEDTMLVFSLLNNYYKNNNSLITLNLYGRKTQIKINTILYLETEGHNISIITTEDIYTYRCTMKELIKMINSKSFIQIQKSIAINFDFVKEIDEENNVILKNDIIFSISRYYKKEALKKYEEYLLQ